MKDMINDYRWKIIVQFMRIMLYLTVVQMGAFNQSTFKNSMIGQDAAELEMTLVEEAQKKVEKKKVRKA